MLARPKLWAKGADRRLSLAGATGGYEGHGADYMDGVRKRTPAMSFPAALFELRLGLRQQGGRFAPVFMARLKSCPDTKAFPPNPDRERRGLFARLRIVA